MLARKYIDRSPILYARLAICKTRFSLRSPKDKIVAKSACLQRSFPSIPNILQKLHHRVYHLPRVQMVLAPIETGAECGEETILVEATSGEMPDGSKIVTSPVANYSYKTEDIQDREEPTPQNVEELDIEEKKTEDVDYKQDQYERDFDKNPTVLYAMIQKKEWDQAIERVHVNPEESRIWVSRHEKDGSLRWRLLPIHAAIVFKAPEEIIEKLLGAYPQGAQAKDDQGMLPLHLAFRTGSSEAVVLFLLTTYPESVNVKDRKGRIPLVLAQASNSPNKEAFMRALERGPKHYAAAAAATERATEAAEQRAILDAKQLQLRQTFEHELETVKVEAEKEKRGLQEKLEHMESELLKAQETSQVLVDHVNSMEAQLTSRSDTERFLATKIATLDSSLKDTCKNKGEVEEQLKTDNFRLAYEKESLKKECEELRIKHDAAEEKLTNTLGMYEKKEKEWTASEQELLQEARSAKLDWANAQANCAIFEAQLKKKIETEHALATQVSALAGKLAESAADNRDSSSKNGKRIRKMEEERIVMRENIRDLTAKLTTVARILADMTDRHNKILEEAKIHEGLIENAMTAHAKIVTDSMKQELQHEVTREERLKMREMLENQEALAIESAEKRGSIINAIAVQGEHMEHTQGARSEMLASVKEMGGEIQDVMSTVISLLPAAAMDAAAMNATPAEEENEALSEPNFTPEDRIMVARR